MIGVRESTASPHRLRPGRGQASSEARFGKIVSSLVSELPDASGLGLRAPARSDFVDLS